MQQRAFKVYLQRKAGVPKLFVRYTRFYVYRSTQQQELCAVEKIFSLNILCKLREQLFLQAVGKFHTLSEYLVGKFLQHIFCTQRLRFVNAQVLFFHFALTLVGFCLKLQVSFLYNGCLFVVVHHT